MKKTLLILILLSKVLFSLEITSCKSGEIFIDGQCIPTVCNDNEYFDYSTYTCKCQTGFMLDGVCSAPIFDGSCDELQENYYFENHCEYGVSVENAHELHTYNNKCYASGSYNLSCITPLNEENLITPVSNIVYTSPNTDDLSDADKKLINEFSSGNKAILNANKINLESKNELILIKEYSKQQLKQNSNTLLKLDGIKSAVQSASSKDIISRGFSGTNYELAKLRNENSENFQKLLNKDSTEIDLNSTNTRLDYLNDNMDYIYERVNSINNILKSNEDNLTKSANNNPLNFSDLNDTLNGFSSDFKSKINNIYLENQDIFGFGGYGSVPSPYTLDLMGHSYKILDISSISSEDITLFRNLFLFIAYISGLMFFLRGD